MKKILNFTIFCLLLIASTTNTNAQLTPCPVPPPTLELESEFCNAGAGIPYNVTSCTDFIVAENGGSDIIYVLSIYYDPASPTPYQAPPGTTFIDVFDAVDNFILYDGFFYDCDEFLNPADFPTALTVTQSVFGEPIVDLTAIAANTCEPVVVSVFVLGFDRTNFLQVDCDVIEIPITLYPTSLTTNVVDDGSTCGTPTVELLAADGTVCETETGAACIADGDSFTTDFAATATGAALAGAPAGCALPADVTIACDGCTPPPPPEEVPTVGEWGLIILGLMMSITAIVGIRQRSTEKNVA